MKKLMITALALFSVTFMASAQETSGKFQGKHRHHHKGHAFQKMNFSPEQKEQAKTFMKDYKQKMSDLEKNDQMTVKEYRLKKEALKKEHMGKMKGLLTPEQKQQIAESRQKRMEQQSARRQQRMEKLGTKLNLSSEQLSSMKSRQEATKKQITDLKKNESYTRGQKREMIKDMMKKNRESFVNSLNDTQKKQLEEMKKNHKQKRMMAK